MSEQTDVKSLAGLANAKGTVSREAPDARTRASSVQTVTRKGGFDGLLKTFLGKDKSTRTPDSSVNSYNQQSLATSLNKRDTRSKSSNNASAQAAGMPARDKRALSRAMDKTVEGGDGGQDNASAVSDGELPSDIYISPEMAAAAEEAALLIWGILYGGVDGLAGFTGGGALAKLADMLAEMQSGSTGGGTLAELSGLLAAASSETGNSLAGLGGGNIDAQALLDAMETANVSAEMNNAAVMAALEELLDGMPRQALRDALAKTAGEMGLAGAVGDEDLFNTIVKALNAEIVDVGETADPSQLLIELRKNAEGIYPGASERQKEVAAAAETSGAPTTDTKILELFKEFLSTENAEGDSGSGEMDADTLDAFVAWLDNSGKSKEVSELMNDKSLLAQVLVAGLTAEQPASGANSEPLFSRVLKNLEKFLQTGTDMKAGQNSEAPAQTGQGISEGSSKAFTISANADTAKEAGIPSLYGSTLTVPAAAGVNSIAPATPAPGGNNSAAVSSMLDQIENIERLTEAMRMVNRNGVKNLTMQLSPPELGKVMLRVVSRDGVVSAYLRVEKPETATQLSMNLSQLRENLKAQGIELGELDIRQQQNQAASDFSGHRHRKDPETNPDAGDASRNGTAAPTAQDEANGTEALGADEHLGGSGMLNLFA